MAQAKGFTKGFGKDIIMTLFVGNSACTDDQRADTLTYHLAILTQSVSLALVHLEALLQEPGSPDRDRRLGGAPLCPGACQHEGHAARLGERAGGDQPRNTAWRPWLRGSSRRERHSHGSTELPRADTEGPAGARRPYPPAPLGAAGPAGAAGGVRVSLSPQRLLQ